MKDKGVLDLAKEYGISGSDADIVDFGKRCMYIADLEWQDKLNEIEEDNSRVKLALANEIKKLMQELQKGGSNEWL